MTKIDQKKFRPKTPKLTKKSTKIDPKSTKIHPKSKGLTPLLLVFGMMINSVTASDSMCFLPRWWKEGRLTYQNGEWSVVYNDWVYLNSWDDTMSRQDTVLVNISIYVCKYMCVWVYVCKYMEVYLVVKVAKRLAWKFMGFPANSG